MFSFFHLRFEKIVIALLFIILLFWFLFFFFWRLLNHCIILFQRRNYFLLRLRRIHCDIFLYLETINFPIFCIFSWSINTLNNEKRIFFHRRFILFHFLWHHRQRLHRFLLFDQLLNHLFTYRIQYLQPSSHCSHRILIRTPVKQSLIRPQFLETNSLVWSHQTCAKFIPQTCSFHNSLIDFFIISLNFRINLNYFHQIWKPSQFQRIFTYFVHSLQTLSSCLLDNQSITKEILPVTLAYTSFWTKHSKESSLNLFVNNR